MKGIVVFIIAVVLSSILVPIGFFWGVVDSFYKRGFKEGYKRLSDFFWDSALSIDQTANVLCREFFNDTLILPNGYKFGNPDETISGVIGKNKLESKLTRAGRLLDWVLDKIDNNHSINSIEIDENNL